MVPEVCIFLLHRGQEAGILEGVLRSSPVDPGRAECMARLHPAIAMDQKGPLETHLGLASYIHASQRAGSPHIVEGTGPEGMRPEVAVLQRGHPAVQFPGDQEHQERPGHLGHLA
jgi:hypothetical protein